MTVYPRPCTQTLHPTFVFVVGGFALALAGCTGSDGPPGDPGTPGVDTLAATSDEPAGANCPFGGIKIEVGPDSNGNGVLDPDEVAAANTAYVCNGEGTNALVRTVPEDVGANCPFGGTRIESGLDINNNDILDDDEVNATATSFVCAFGPSGSLSPSTGVRVIYRPAGVSTAAADPISVRFNLRDDRGFPLDLTGAYSLNTEIQPRFAVGYFTKNPTTGIVSPLTVYTKSISGSNPNGAPTNYNPRGSGASNGTLVENGLGAGDYTYTFPTTGGATGVQAVAYDASKLDETHVIWIQVTRQTDLQFTINANTFYAADEPLYYVPSGTGTPQVREIAAQSSCDGCHKGFEPETTVSAAFHGGARVAVGMCNVCHNPARQSNPVANSSSFIHRIHNGEQVADANLFHGIAATYPQDVRNCNTCHGAAAQGAQSLTNPSTLACKGCHDYVSFTSSATQFCKIVGQLDRGPDGKPLACNHVGGPVADDACESCHGPTRSFPTEKYHRPVAPPDPNNAWLTSGTNNNTNASFVAAGGYVPPGADVITYDVTKVETVTDTSVTPAVKRPQITFKLKRNGTDVVFQTFAAGSVTELMPGFVGSPSVYFAFAVPQDGNPTPSDFNASASGYIKAIWDGSATGKGAGTMSGPNGSGYYTIKLTGVQIPPEATLLTGGVGYTYSLSSTPPLVQIDVPEYPWMPNVPADGKAQGGLSVPAPNVWKVATGFTGRRAIVDTDKCNNCHGKLGVTPTFHAGQRNDGPTCSFCHNPNRTSSGWAASSKYFIHAIHAGRKRVEPFTWHASEPGEGFGDVEFPGTLNKCTTCHVENTFDFTNAGNLAAVPNMELTTVGTGKYNTNPATNPTGYFSISPYVVGDNVTDYGKGFAYDPGTNLYTTPAVTTLVITPIMAACSACHDAPPALDHMRSNGGQFYAPRSAVLGGAQEQCLICHGPGRIAAIGEVHQK